MKAADLAENLKLLAQRGLLEGDDHVSVPIRTLMEAAVTIEMLLEGRDPDETVE